MSMGLNLFVVAGWEWIVILIVIAFIFLFGSKKIPELAKAIGRSRAEFEKGKREALEEMEKMKEKDERGRLEKIAKDLGIETEGKSEEELREAIKKSLEK